MKIKKLIGYILLIAGIAAYFIVLILVSSVTIVLEVIGGLAVFAGFVILVSWLLTDD